MLNLPKMKFIKANENIQRRLEILPFLM